MNQIPNIEEEYTSHEALKEWEEEKDQNNLTQNIVALLGIHGMHCKFYEYQNASHITKAFEDLFHHQLQKAREETKARTIFEEDLIEIAEMIANGNAFDKENGLIWQHVIDEAKRLCLLRDAVQASNHSELDQDKK